MLPVYNKKASSISDQTVLLEQRGLVIKDKAVAEHFLTHIGYYRLAGYWQIFQKDAIKHIFHPNTTFESIIDLYNFDRELRLLIYDAIERIEISFRSVMVNQMCMAHTAEWYHKLQYAQDVTLFDKNLEKIDEELDRSREEFITHHDNKYGKTYPPAWKTMQILSFGTLSKIYSNISTKLPEKNLIAKAMGLPNYTFWESWMVVITVLRNLCAHHSRICYRKYGFPPKRLQTSPYPWIKQLPVNMHFSEMLYNQIGIVKFVLHQSSPGNHFSLKLKNLIAKYPVVNPMMMGFPKGWENEALWQ